MAYRILDEKKGNIDLYSRPKVQNSDGSYSTVRSMSFNIDGKEVLLPSISDEGIILKPDEIIEQYKKTGKHLGIFNTPEEANIYAQQLHEQQSKIYGNQDKPKFRILDENPELIGKPQPTTWDKISGNVLDALVGIGGIGRNLPLSQETKQGIVNIAEPTAKGIGMGLGGTAGNVFGSYAMRPQYGAMVGAGLGNAAGGVISDILKSQLTDYVIPPAKEQTQKMGRDVMEGATWEGIGQVSIPVLKLLSWPIRKTYGLVKSAFPHFTEQQAREQAARELKPIMDKILSEEILSQNVDDAEKVGRDIGAQFTVGQESRSPEAILKERYLARRYPEIGFEDQKQQDLLMKTINQYYNKNFPGKEGGEELINAVTSQKQNIDDLLLEAAKNQVDEISKLSTAKRPYDIGETIKKIRESEVVVRRGTKNQLYGEVPNIEVPTNKLINTVNEVRKFFEKNPQYKQYAPDSVLDVIEETAGSGKAQFQNLWGLRKPIYEALKYSQDEPIARGQLERLKGAIESNLDDVLAMGGDVAEKYGKAAKYYKESYRPLYEGVTGEIGRVNRYGEPKVKLENIPGRIFNDVSNAKQFMESIGQNQSAKESMRDYISHEILNNPTIYNHQTNSINSMAYSKWFRQNKDILDQLKQTKNFSNLGKVSEKVAEVEAKSGEFAKSVASRVLDSDVNKVVENIFSGANKKKSAQTMSQLITELRKMPDGEIAIKGLRQSFADYFKNYFETSQTTMGGEALGSVAKYKIFMKEYRPALAVLYKNEPQKIKALDTIRDAFEIARRNQTTPFTGGGSPTAEHVLQALPRSIGARIYKFIPLLGGGISTNIEQFNRRAVDQLVYRALYDPEIAHTLVYGYRLKPDAFAGMLRGHLIGLGLYGTMGNQSNN